MPGSFPARPNLEGKSTGNEVAIIGIKVVCEPHKEKEQSGGERNIT